MPLPCEEFKMIEQEPEDFVTQMYARIIDLLTPTTTVPEVTQSMYDIITPMFEGDKDEAKPAATHSWSGLMLPQPTGPRLADDIDAEADAGQAGPSMGMESVASFMQAAPLGGRDDDAARVPSKESLPHSVTSDTSTYHPGILRPAR